jgi:hypothetical protein
MHLPEQAGTDQGESLSAHDAPPYQSSPIICITKDYCGPGKRAPSAI